MQWPLVLAALLLVTWSWASHPALRQELVYFASGLAVFVLGASAVDDGQVGRGLQIGLLAAAFCTALLGLCQYFGLSALATPWVDYAEAGEAFGNLRQPNQFASLCWLGVVIVLWGMPRLPTGAAVGFVVVLAVASAASVSRTGMLQGAMVAALASIWPGPEQPRRLRLCAVAAVAYCVGTVLLPFGLHVIFGALPGRTLWGRIGGGEACSSRMVLWSNVLHLIAQKPFFGWGWGELDYAHFMTLYPGARFCDILDNAHNLPLHLAVELGVPAAVTVCGTVVWWMVRQRPWQERDAQRQLGWGVLAIILLHSLLEYPLWYGPFQIALGASLGWLLGRPHELTRRAPSWLAVGMAAAMFVATVYASWDYARVSQIYLSPESRRPRWASDPLGEAKRSWLFANQARFAELTLTMLTLENAEWMRVHAEEALHYSPEPRVIERLVESASLTGHLEEAGMILTRYRAAFPREYAAWQTQQHLDDARTH